VTPEVETLREKEGAHVPDDMGSPERAAPSEDEHPLESPDAIRRPPDESGEQDQGPARATPAARDD
jgi:hypothetical protein